MNTPAIPTLPSAPHPNSPINNPAPWEKNRTTHINNDNQINPLGSGRIVSHNQISKTHSFKIFLLITLSIFSCLIAYFIIGSYHNWPHPYPYPATVRSFTDKTLANSRLIPLTSQIILRATLTRLIQEPVLSHKITISGNSPQIKFHQDIVGTSDTDPDHQNDFSLLTQISTNSNSLQLQTNIINTDTKIFIIPNQQSPHPLLDFTNFSHGLYFRKPTTNSSSQIETTGIKSLNDIRTSKLSQVQQKILTKWINSTTYIPDHGFSSTHHLIEWQTTPEELSEYLKQILDTYRQTTSNIQLSSSLDLIQSQTTKLFTHPIQGSMLINRDTLFPEHISLKTQITLSENNLPVELTYILNTSNTPKSAPPPSNPELLNQTTIAQNIYDPFIQALANIMISSE